MDLPAADAKFLTEDDTMGDNELSSFFLPSILPHHALKRRLSTWLGRERRITLFAGAEQREYLLRTEDLWNPLKATEL